MTLHNNGVVLSVLSVAEGLNCTAKDSPIAFLWRRHVLYCRWHIRHVAGLGSCRVRGEKRGLFQISILRSRAFVCPEVNSTLDFPRPFFLVLVFTKTLCFSVCLCGLNFEENYDGQGDSQGPIISLSDDYLGGEIFILLYTGWGVAHTTPYTLMVISFFFFFSKERKMPCDRNGEWDHKSVKDSASSLHVPTACLRYYYE